jgi:hypothetical protein
MLRSIVFSLILFLAIPAYGADDWAKRWPSDTPIQVITPTTGNATFWRIDGTSTPTANWDLSTYDFSADVLYATEDGQSILQEGLVVNEAGGGAATDDFRAETDNEENAFVVDASGDDIEVNVPLASTDSITSPNFVSNVAIGTSPYAATSTTLNTNLNADLWDGYQFSDYLDQAVKTTSNVSFGTIGGTSLTTSTIAGTHLTLGTVDVGDPTYLMTWGSDDGYGYSGLPLRMYWNPASGVTFDDGAGNGLPITAGYYYGFGTTLTGIGVLASANTWTLDNTFRRSNIKAVRTDAVVLENNTDATETYKYQDSPSLRFKGHAWVSSADYDFDFSMEGKANSSNPYFQIGLSKNGAAYSNIFSVDSYGQFLQEVIRASWAAGETLTAGFRCSNDAAATVSADQYSGCFKFHSQGWKTAATAASRLMYLWEVNAPEQGVTYPIGVHKWMYGINAYPTAATESMRIEWGDNTAIGMLNAVTPKNNSLQVNGDLILAHQTDVGAEKITNGSDFAAGWTADAGAWHVISSAARKDTDGVTTLSQTSAAMVTPLVIGETYLLSFDVTNMTVVDGSLVVTCGGQTRRNCTTNNGTYTWTFTATSTDDLVFTPSINASRFYIDNVSLKKITGGDLNINGTATLPLLNYAADAEASDTYAVTIPNLSITTGTVVYFKANTANTGACTLNVNGTGAVSLKSLHDQDPADNYIEAGSIVHCVYDGTNWQILSPDANP